MRFVGIDLGLRSAYLAFIDNEDSLFLEQIVLKPNKMDRVQELTEIFDFCFPLINGDKVFIEEPVVAGARNLRTSLQIAQTAGVVLLASGRGTRLVPVTSWKKGVIGKGNATKEEISAWLAQKYPKYYKMCNGDQNLVDATCIALYRRDSV